MSYSDLPNRSTQESNVTFLTPAAFQKLEEELELLLGSGREEISARIAEARAHGDLRENADYDAAKNEQGMMEARIRQLQHLLNTAKVEEVPESSQVVVGSMVTVRDQNSQELQYFVASPENKVDSLLMASPTSPIGKALLGAETGSTVRYQSPTGEIFKLEIVDITPYRPT